MLALVFAAGVSYSEQVSGGVYIILYIGNRTKEMQDQGNAKGLCVFMHVSYEVYFYIIVRLVTDSDYV